MNQILKKGLVIVSLIIFSLTTINCKKDKDDNTGLLLAALYLLNQTEYTVTMSATLLDSSDLAIRDGKVTLTAGANDILVANQATISDFTACQTNAPLTTANQKTTTGLDGEFNLNFKVNSTSGTFTLTTVGSTGASATSGTCDQISALDASTFTDSIGTATMALNINESDLTNTNQVVITASGFKINVKTISIVKRGTYNLVSPTVGENICDGKSVTGSPITKSGTISGSETWSDAVLLTGTILVESGATITLSPGTVVFGQRGSSIFFKPGSKLVSKGSASSPICWTSANTPGSRFPGDWGGIVMIGNSGASRSSNTEGTTPQSYGGAAGANANNLEMEYTIVEFGGNEVAPGDELNNLSMYASNTTLNNVQVHRGLDDGFEAWGGSGTWTNLLATGGLDDDFDLDEGFSGTLTNLISHKYPTTCGGSLSTDPHAFEMDGVHSGNGTNCSSSSIGRCTTPTISGFTLIGQSNTGGEGMRLREGLAGSMSNGLVYNFVTYNIRATASGSFPTNSTTINNTVLVQTGKTAENNGITNNATISLTALPISSEGNVAGTDCGFAATKPNYTSTAAQTGGGAGSWYSNWTVYRAR